MINHLRPTRYTVKKNDNLDLIAKKHGYASWKVIYGSDLNLQLRKQCSDPNKILPGIVVLLPPKTSEIIMALKRSNERILNAKKDFEIEVDKEIFEVNKSFKKVESVGSNIDTAASVAFILKDLSKLAYKGLKAIKLDGDKLKEINKVMAKDSIEMAYTPSIEAGLKVYSEADLDKNIITVSSQILITSFFEMSAPSFWANTISNLMNGMSWSKAVTTKPKDVRDKTIKEILRQKDNFIRSLDNRIDENNRIINKFSKHIDRPLPLKLS